MSRRRAPGWPTASPPASRAWWPSAIPSPRPSSRPGKACSPATRCARDLLGGDAARAAAHWRLDPATPTIYITGGALGAHAINEAVRAALPDLLAVAQVVHQVGEGPDGSRADITAAEAQAQGSGAAQARYRPVAFVGPTRTP